MKKQAVARALCYQLAARLQLDAALGALYQHLSLPDPMDLSRVIDSTEEAASAQPAAAIPSAPSVPSASPSKRLAEAPTESAPARAKPVQTLRKTRVVTVSELGEAAGVHLPPLADEAPADDRAAAIAPVQEEALSCERCGLCKTRQQVVFGEGDLQTDLVFVGEAPGRDEDIQGRPFVGRAGQLLTAMIEKGMQRPRDSVYICNILKCRPPRNRDPEPDEVRHCTAYLHQQLAIIRPKLIIALGRVSGQILSGERSSMRRLRGRMLSYRGIPLLPTYHPAYLLRLRERSRGKTREDRETWEDLQKAMRFLQRKAEKS